MDKPNFENLHEIFAGQPAKLEVIRGWEKEYRKAALVKNLYEHDAVKQLVKLLNGFIADNEVKLKNQKRSDFQNDNLYFDERVRLSAEIGCWSLIIGFFTKAESKMNAVASNVKETQRINKK